MALLTVLVWALAPQRVAFKPAPLRPATGECPKLSREFIPTNITGFRDRLLDGLTAAERNRTLYRLNMEPCTCGCSTSVAGCRVNNPACPVSRKLAERIVREVRTKLGRPKS